MHAQAAKFRPPRPWRGGENQIQGPIRKQTQEQECDSEILPEPTCVIEYVPAIALVVTVAVAVPHSPVVHISTTFKVGGSVVPWIGMLWPSTKPYR